MKENTVEWNTGETGDINGIIDLTDKGIGVRQSFLLWAVWARWIDYNKDEQKRTDVN